MENTPPDVASPARPAAPPPGGQARLERWRRWLPLALLWLLPLALLAKLCALGASRYYLEIPVRTAVDEVAQVYYSPDPPLPGNNTVIVTVYADMKTAPVRFLLRGQKIVALRFDPTMNDHPLVIGTPRLHCLMDAYVRMEAYRYDLSLASIHPLHDVDSLTLEDGWLRITPKPGTTDPYCEIRLDRPISLGFHAPTFWRAFLPGAVLWSLLAVALFRWTGSLFSRVQPLTASLLAFRPPAALPTPGYERWLLWVMFVLSTVVQGNAILHHGAMGQDYEYNFGLSKQIAAHPEAPLPYAPTNPHGFHVVNALIIRLTGGVHAEEVCGFFNVAVNLGAWWVFYLLARRFVRHPLWRLTLMTLVTFLPLRLIHTVVIAADALTLLPMFTLAWVLARITDETTTLAQRRWLALAASLLLLVGLEVKYTFMSSVVAVALTLLQLARRRRVPWKEAGLLTFLALFLALLVPWLAARRARADHPDFTEGMGLDILFPSLMSYKDIFALKKTDGHIFRAPPWDEPLDPAKRAAFNGKPVDPGPPYELLKAHRYSYLALNHLVVFTDADNIFQYDPFDVYFGQRNGRNQRRMALAVKTGVPITLLCIVCVAALGGASVIQGVLRPVGGRPDLEAVFLLGIGWFANMVVFLPFVAAPVPSIAGLWGPRLNMAALLLFLLLTAYVLDRCARGRAGLAAAWVSFVFVVCLSALYISFLWPWGKM